MTEIFDLRTKKSEISLSQSDQIYEASLPSKNTVEKYLNLLPI
jgi:hypothetical protein